MKTLTLIVLSTLLAASCGGNAGSGEISEPEAVEFIGQFLVAMNNTPVETRGLERFVAPSFNAENGITASMYLLNRHSFEDYKVLSYSAPYINIRMLSYTYEWSREMSFKLVRENGVIFIMPRSQPISSGYIDPWWTHGEIQR